MKRFFALGLVVMLSTWSSLIESFRLGTRGIKRASGRCKPAG